MTRSQIIRNVQNDTEHKNDTQFDWEGKLDQVLQELCAKKRFWWRKKYLSFSTTSGTAQYDLTSITTTPTNAGLFVEEITAVTGIDSSNNAFHIESETDDETIVSYVNDSTTDQPTRWMPDPSSLSNGIAIRLYKTPNATFTIYVTFWAMPTAKFDDSDDTIYILPPAHHHVLQTMLEAEVWRLDKGNEDPRYIAALQKAEDKISQMKIQRSLDAGYDPRFTNKDDEAVRSTGDF